MGGLRQLLTTKACHIRAHARMVFFPLFTKFGGAPKEGGGGGVLNPKTLPTGSAPAGSVLRSSIIYICCLVRPDSYRPCSSNLKNEPANSHLWLQTPCPLTRVEGDFPVSICSARWDPNVVCCRLVWRPNGMRRNEAASHNTRTILH